MWTGRNGQKLWDGPFDTAGRAWGRLQQIIDAQPGFVVSGTQMSNTVPSRPAPDVHPASEFQAAVLSAGPAAENPDGYGPWFIASFDSDCDGPCGGEILAGQHSRSDGAGGWLCASCGEK
jgi:hypothetical protein